MGSIFSKPSAPEPQTPQVAAAAPAPVDENAKEDSQADDSLTKKKRGKASLMATPINNANTGVNL